MIPSKVSLVTAESELSFMFALAFSQDLKAAVTTRGILGSMYLFDRNYEIVFVRTMIVRATLFKITTTIIKLNDNLPFIVISLMKCGMELCR